MATNLNNVKSLGLLLLLVVIAVVNTCHVTFDKDGNYTLSVEGDTTWLHGHDTAFMAGGKWYSTDDGSLKIISENTTTGKDELGDYVASTLTLQGDGGVGMEVEARSYGMLKPEVVMFVQRFPNGIKGTKFEANKTNTAFPTFKVDKAEEDVGYLSYGGMMWGDYGKTTGQWEQMANINDGMDGTGPLVLFNKNGSAMVLSPYNHVMAASMWYDKEAAILKYGVMGGVDEIPAGFELKTIAYCTKTGPGDAIAEWGKLMRDQHGKTDAVTKYHQSQDLSLSHLGYWTDNGAYYYYNTENGKNYEQTVMDLRQDFLQQIIPYRYIQLDSWFYPKDNMTKGTTLWAADESVFPSGLDGLQEKLNFPIVAHNRYWSVNTTYAIENGGLFDFFIGHNMSLPQDQIFWDYLLGHGREEWGLVVYEQDWLNVQLLFTEILNTDLLAGERWLTQMGIAAARHGVKIQYCMALPRQALQSLDIHEVTQARVSNDYHLEVEQWRIGVTSHLADALGVAPSKDTFWTKTNQPGNTYNKVEPHPALQIVVAVLSKGPVGPGDMLKTGTDADTLLKCCNSDGLILKPSKPARAIDEQLIEAAFRDGRSVKGEVWTTYSNVNGSLYGIIFAADLAADVIMTPQKAGFMSKSAPKFTDGIIYTVDGDNVQSTNFSESEPNTIGSADCMKTFFCLFYTAPTITIEETSINLLGDLNKWVPMSEQRIFKVWQTNTSIAVTVSGYTSELVQFWYMVDGVVKVLEGEANMRGCYTFQVWPKGVLPIAPVDLDCRPSTPPITTPAAPTYPPFIPIGGASALTDRWAVLVAGTVAAVLTMMQ